MTDPIIAQLKRIHGQVSGVIAMYENDRECVDVVRQIIAIRNSLTSVAREMFTTEAHRCSAERNISELDALLKEMFKYQ